MTDFESLNYLTLILTGAWVTVQLTAAGIVVALIVAFVAGFGRLSKFRALQFLSVIYIEFFRGTSIFVQLFWAYFVLPFLGIPLSPFETGVIVLGFNVGAYGAEVVRSAILAVPREQWEVCTALNMKPFKRMTRIILPQAIPIMLPTFGNNAVELLKGTAVVSLISISDLTFQAQVARSQTGDTVIPFLGILVIYYVLSLFLARFVKIMENLYNRGR